MSGLFAVRVWLDCREMEWAREPRAVSQKGDANRLAKQDSIACMKYLVKPDGKAMEKYIYIYI